MGKASWVLVAIAIIAMTYFADSGSTKFNQPAEVHARSTEESNSGVVSFEPQCRGALAASEQFRSRPREFVPPRKDAAFPLPRPLYPPESKRSREEGTVLLQLFVTEQGMISKARIAKSSGWPRLDDAAIRGASQWRLIPARASAIPACTWVSAPVTFKLSMDPDAPAES